MGQRSRLFFFVFLSSVSVNASFTNRKGMLSGGKLLTF